MILRELHHSADAVTGTEKRIVFRRLITGMGIIAALFLAIEVLYYLNIERDENQNDK